MLLDVRFCVDSCLMIAVVVCCSLLAVVVVCRLSSFVVCRGLLCVGCCCFWCLLTVVARSSFCC